MLSLTTLDRPFFEQAPPTPSSISSFSPSLSSAAHKTSRRMPPRSATAPLPRGPPSPELSNLDCAFPPFPISKSRSATPTRERESKQSRSSHAESIRTHAEPSPLFAPLSPRRNGNGRILQRMDTIAPGPFDVGSRDRRGGSQGPTAQQHKITATVASSQDFPLPPTYDPAKPGFPRPSTATSNTGTSRKTSLASISGGPRSMFDKGEQKLSSKPPSEPPLPRNERPEGPWHTPHQELPPRPLRHDNRSQTFPIGIQNQGSIEEPVGSQTQKPSESSLATRSRRPTVSATSRPPLPANAVSQGLPFRSTPGIGLSQSQSGPEILLRDARRKDGRDSRADNRPEAAPPIQVPGRTNVSSNGSSYHTPTDSISSSGSYGSNARSGSSRSSPPLSDVSARPRAKPTDIDTLGNSWINFESSTEKLHSKEIKEVQSDISSSGVGAPTYQHPKEPSPRRDAKLEPPESPMDPAMQKGRLSPFTPTSDHHPSEPVTKQLTLAPPPARRKTASNKGNCRGCGELITGKSVSSADGRLTGRYHKQCFVCKTCKQPFQTADFYVLKDHPYCDRHYHQLNDSLCRACDRGIEGQYLATESKQKFHPLCFTCRVRTVDESIDMQKAGTDSRTRIAA